MHYFDVPRMTYQKSSPVQVGEMWLICISLLALHLASRGVMMGGCLISNFDVWFKGQAEIMHLGPKTKQITKEFKPQ